LFGSTRHAEIAIADDIIIMLPGQIDAIEIMMKEIAVDDSRSEATRRQGRLSGAVYVYSIEQFSDGYAATLWQ